MNACTFDAQSVELGVAVLRLASKEGDRPAGLALISSLRKRLMNLPGELAADELLRVRLQGLTQLARHRLMLSHSASSCCIPLQQCSVCTHCRLHRQHCCLPVLFMSGAPCQVGCLLS